VIKPKLVKKVNNVYQIDEGIFDILKAIVTGKNTDITKTPDSKLSKQGRALKKATLDLEKKFAAEAKRLGMTPEEYVADIKRLYGK
jgi:hypothetical protein